MQQNLHRDGILAVTQVPAPDVSRRDAAVARSTRRASLADGMGYVGVLCVEFFVLQDGSLVANEMAPRPHNSGHYSIDACDVSQFELQVRCMAGLPLVQPRLHSSAVMLNLLGDLWFDAGRRAHAAWAEVLALPGAHLHLYGKANARRARKMGHLTVTGGRCGERARRSALQAAHCWALPPVLNVLLDGHRSARPLAQAAEPPGRGRAGRLSHRDRLRPGRARRRRCGGGARSSPPRAGRATIR